MAIVLMLSVAAAGSAQETVSEGTAITLFQSSGTTARQLSGTIAESLELTLRLANVRPIVRADFLTPEESLEATAAYYQREALASAVFGEIEALETGGFRVSATIWTSEGEQTDSIEREIDSVFGIFGFADELALDIASVVVGRDLVFGTVRINGAARLGDFGVYVDGQLVSRGSSRVEVLSGSREITIAAPGPLGDQPVERFEVEVPEEDSVELAMDPDLVSRFAGESAASDADAAGSEEDGEADNAAALGRVETGQLLVRSSPSNTQVFLDDRLLGRTPFEAFSIQTGVYEISLERELFEPVTTAVTIEARETTSISPRLALDRDHPRVSANLLPRGVRLASLTTTAAKVGLLILGGQAGQTWSESFIGNGGAGAVPGALLDLAALSALQPAIWMSADSETATIVSGITAASAALSLGLAFWDVPPGGQNGRGFFGTLGWVLPQLGLFLFDQLGAPVLAARTNSRILSGIRRTGTAGEPTRAAPRRFVVEAGAGGLARASYAVPIINQSLRADLGLGFSLVPDSQSAVGLVASGRLAVRPFMPERLGVKPEFSALIQAEYDFDRLGFSLGPALGTVVSFRRFELVWRINYLYGFRTRSSRFVSSIAVGL
jgi:hypothetical protein